MSDHFKTNDMVLATLLIMEGLDYEHARTPRAPSGDECVWLFADMDANAHRLVRDFAQRRALVEPREFARCWADVRRNMFAFLGPRRRR